MATPKLAPAELIRKLQYCATMGAVQDEIARWTPADMRPTADRELIKEIRTYCDDVGDSNTDAYSRGRCDGIEEVKNYICGEILCTYRPVDSLRKLAVTKGLSISVKIYYDPEDWAIEVFDVHDQLVEYFKCPDGQQLDYQVRTWLEGQPDVEGKK